MNNKGNYNWMFIILIPIGIIYMWIFSKVYSIAIYPIVNDILTPVSGQIAYYDWIMLLFALVPTIVIIFFMIGLINNFKNNNEQQ